MSAKDRKDEMLALRKTGKTFREIAEQYGISQQRVYTILRDVCSNEDRARKHSLNIENIVYQGIYELFVNDYKMTETKLARIVYDVKRIRSCHLERVRNLMFNHGEVKLSVRHIKNICNYIGKPFEEVFRLR